MIYDDEQGDDHYSGQGASAERGCFWIGVVLAVAFVLAIAVIYYKTGWH